VSNSRSLKELEICINTICTPLACGTLCPTAGNNVSEEIIASIFKVEMTGAEKEVDTLALAVPSRSLHTNTILVLKWRQIIRPKRRLLPTAELCASIDNLNNHS
jgi:hypothetical protein